MTNRRWPLYALVIPTLVGAVVLPDLADVRHGRLSAAYAPYVLDEDPPPYDLVGVDPKALRMASIDGLRQPRILPPVICGGHAVAGIWSTTIWTGTGSHIGKALKYSGTVRNGSTGLLAFRHQGPGWQLLTGTNSFTGALSLVGATALTAAPPASKTWSIGTGSLLCIDTVEVSDGDTPFTATSTLAITYPTGAGTVYLDGARTVTAGATVSRAGARTRGAPTRRQTRPRSWLRWWPSSGRSSRRRARSTSTRRSPRR
jgi:hypothetical protein